MEIIIAIVAILAGFLTGRSLYIFKEVIQNKRSETMIKMIYDKMSKKDKLTYLELDNAILFLRYMVLTSDSAIVETKRIEEELTIKGKAMEELLSKHINE